MRLVIIWFCSQLATIWVVCHDTLPPLSPISDWLPPQVYYRLSCEFIFRAKHASTRVTPPYLKRHELRQVIHTSGVTASLLADTHSAHASPPSNHLCSLMSMRDCAAKVLADKYAAKQSLFGDDPCMEEDSWSSFDNRGWPRSASGRSAS